MLYECSLACSAAKHLALCVIGVQQAGCLCVFLFGVTVGRSDAARVEV